MIRFRRPFKIEPMRFAFMKFVPVVDADGRTFCLINVNERRYETEDDSDYGERVLTQIDSVLEALNGEIED